MNTYNNGLVIPPFYSNNHFPAMAEGFSLENLKELVQENRDSKRDIYMNSGTLEVTLSKSLAQRLAQVC